MKLQRGFTLIELLVVIAVIGILASVVLASLSTAQGKVRDSKRISELKQLQTALELYYNDNGKYPGNGQHYISTTGCILAPGSNLWSTIFDSNVQSKYMSQLPVDPKGPTDTSYCYDYDSYSNQGSNYTAWTCTLPNGTVVDPDGQGSGSNPGHGYAYMLVFRGESDLSATYPRASTPSNAYCLFGPQR